MSPYIYAAKTICFEFFIIHQGTKSDNKDKGKIMKVQETQSFYKAGPGEAVL